MNSIPCDYSKIRASSLDVVKELGYQANDNLPLLDEVESLRGTDSVLDRTLALFGAVAVSYGFPAKSAVAWLEGEGLLNILSPSESSYIKNGESSSASFQCQVEALWALSWMLGINDKLDMGSLCSNDFIQVFPNLKTGETSEAFRAHIKLRSIDEIIQVADVAYCLHWAVRQENIGKATTGKIPLYVVEQRRKALDWVLGDDVWDNVALDT